MAIGRRIDVCVATCGAPSRCAEMLDMHKLCTVARLQGNFDEHARLHQGHQLKPDERGFYGLSQNFRFTEETTSSGRCWRSIRAAASRRSPGVRLLRPRQGLQHLASRGGAIHFCIEATGWRSGYDAISRATTYRMRRMAARGFGKSPETTMRQPRGVHRRHARSERRCRNHSGASPAVYAGGEMSHMSDVGMRAQLGANNRNYAASPEMLKGIPHDFLSAAERAASGRRGAGRPFQCSGQMAGPTAVIAYLLLFPRRSIMFVGTRSTAVSRICSSIYPATACLPARILWRAYRQVAETMQI